MKAPVESFQTFARGRSPSTYSSRLSICTQAVPSASRKTVPRL